MWAHFWDPSLWGVGGERGNPQSLKSLEPMGNTDAFPGPGKKACASRATLER